VRRLARQPDQIRISARSLVNAIRDQINDLNASIPNPPEELARHKSFVAFLEMIAAESSQIADALDRALLQVQRLRRSQYFWDWLPRSSSACKIPPLGGWMNTLEVSSIFPFE
jgi:hypothetical protein